MLGSIILTTRLMLVDPKSDSNISKPGQMYGSKFVANQPSMLDEYLTKRKRAEKAETAYLPLQIM